MINKKNTITKRPPDKQIQSIQYDLFSQFVTNDKTGVSNTVEIWESIPKYFFTPHQVEKLRTPSGHADPYSWEYKYNDVLFAVEVQPALLKEKNGPYKAYFPGVTEELVEEALKKIFSDQQYGIHDPKNSESWIRFSLSMIHKELQNRGRTRDRKQIKHALKVMSSCVITLYKEGKEIWKGSILQDLVTVGREDYLADSSAYHIARLPLFISHSIDKLEYRQFNYERLMRCDEQLTRWIYKQLIHRYRQASLQNDYHFVYSNLAQNSGLLQQGREDRNREKVKSALNELVKSGVLIKYTITPYKEGRKIVDIKYTVTPSYEFEKEQKAANKRAYDNQEKLALNNTTIK